MTLSASIGCGRDTRVVDEDVEPFVVAEDRFTELANLLERGEVRPVETGAADSFARDRLDDLHPPLTIAAVDDDVHAHRAESDRQLVAQPARRARNESHLLAGWGSRRLRRGRGGA